MRASRFPTQSIIYQISNNLILSLSSNNTHSVFNRFHELKQPNKLKFTSKMVFSKSEPSVISARHFASTNNVTIKQRNSLKNHPHRPIKSSDDYKRAIQDLNMLQSNSQVISLAKYRNPDAILPLFKRQMQLAGVKVDQLNKLNPIHVSGTKGKGSTCAFTESIVRNAGLKTGFYNSPHLVKVTERIQLNGKPIEEGLFARYFRQIFDRLLEGSKRENITMPSYFSFLTILAFHIFIEEQVDCAIIEVGMGGEYDPTNIIERPVACGITTLDFDHTNVLGNTIESIAWNKAGIIKSDVPVFTVEHEQREAMKVIENRAKDKNSSLHICPPISSNISLNLGIPSSAQYLNAALACHLACCLLKKLFKLTSVSSGSDLDKLPRHFRDGLENCQWSGRCQILELNDKMCFFLDGAHTRKSMENCLGWFKSSSQARDPYAQQFLMVNVIGDRDKTEVLRPLTGHDGFSHAVFSTNRINAAGDTPKSETFVNLQGPNSEKSLDNAISNARIWTSLKKHSCDTVIIKSNTYDAIKAIEQLVMNGKRCHILATGSLHFVGAVLETMSIINNKMIE